jgi:hypothetical protein
MILNVINQLKENPVDKTIASRINIKYLHKRKSL